jgi:ABC-type multidrug transport system fused ATPase/permease subunit
MSTQLETERKTLLSDHLADHNKISIPSIESKQNKPQPFEELYEFALPKKPSADPKNWFCRFFNTNANGIFWPRKPTQPTLQPKDLLAVAEANKVKHVMKDVPSKSIWGVFHHAKKRMIQSIIFTVIAGLVQLAIPFITKEFTTQHKLIWKQPPHSRSVLPLVWLLLAVAAVFCVRLYFNNKGIFYRRQANVAKAARVLIFEKMFDLNIIHHGHFVDTTMINLVTSDVENIFACVMIIPGFTSAILNLTLQFYFIYPFKIYDLALVAFLLLIVALFRWITAVARRKLAVLQRSNDHITKSLKEFMAAVEYSKTFHLQGVFYRLLMRKKEQQSYISKSYIGWTQAAEVISSIAPNLFGLIYFAIQLLATKPPSSTEDDAGLSLAQTYSILTVLSIMRVPINSIKDTFMLFPNFMVSKRRIEIFLQKTLEKPPNEIQTTDIPLCQIEFYQANVCYAIDKRSSETNEVLDTAKLEEGDKEIDIQVPHHKDTLHEVSIKINSGSNIAIIGPSSSGKTTLLLSILGETEVRSGSIHANGRTTYLPEEPCLVEDSIFQNVIMGTPFDPDRYQSALRFSKLDSALACIENGDRLVVKDNGSSLSYKIRKLICLARMFYHEYDLYLIDHFFDDISHEYIHYFAEEVMKKHLAHKTILVTTRSLEICNLFDRIIVMDEGRIVQVGEFEELERDRDGMFFTMLHQNANYQKKRKTNKKQRYLDRGMKLATMEVEALCVEEDKKVSNEANKNEIPVHNPFPVLEPYPRIRSEKKWGRILARYFMAQGLLLPILYIVLLFMTQSLALGSTIFATVWRSNLIPRFIAWEYFMVYVAITVLNILTSLLRRYFRVKYFRRISFELFGTIIKGLLNQSITFFRTTSLASKMATFVAGYDEIDEQAGKATSNLLSVLMTMALGVIAMCFETYFTGGPIVIVFVIFIWLLWKIVKGDSHLKQILIQDRTFVLNSVIDTYRGLLTFRNSGHREYLLENNMTLNDIYLNTVAMDTNLQQRWMNSRVSLLALLFPLLVMLDVIIDAAINWSPEDIANGLKFTIAIDVCIVGSSLVPTFISYETFIAELMDIIKKDSGEKAAEQQILSLPYDKHIIANPKNKKIKHSIHSATEVNHLTVDHDNMKVSTKKVLIELKDLTYFNPFMKSPTLADVSLKIFAGESVGIVGRNGSGKHTILRLLACLSTPKGIAAGTLRILDREVSREEEKDPQDDIMFLSSDYCMFEGTLRSNIDPLGKFTDEVIIQLFDYLGLWELLPKEKEETIKQNSLVDPVNDYDELLKVKVSTAHLSFKYGSNISNTNQFKDHSEEDAKYDQELNKLFLKKEPRENSPRQLGHKKLQQKKQRCLSSGPAKPDKIDNDDVVSEKPVCNKVFQDLQTTVLSKEIKIRETKRYLLQRKTLVLGTQNNHCIGQRSSSIINPSRRKMSIESKNAKISNQANRESRLELGGLNPERIQRDSKKQPTFTHGEIMKNLTTAQTVEIYREKIAEDKLNLPQKTHHRNMEGRLTIISTKNPPEQLLSPRPVKPIEHNSPLRQPKRRSTFFKVVEEAIKRFAHKDLFS